LTRTIDRHLPCQPSTLPLSTDEIKQLTAWKRLISWERSNPLKTDDLALLTRRVILAYEQCLLCLGYHVDLWYEACAYLEQTSRIYAERGDVQQAKRYLDDASTLYERAIQTYMRSNMLIHFAYADLEENRLHVDKARSIYNRLLDINDKQHLNDPTLAYIQAMRFERRVDGIEAARTLFKRARDDPRANHQAYVAAALMEYYCTKDNNIAFKIFNLGLKKHGQNIDYILAYIDFMTHLNEDHNVRVLFERVLAIDGFLTKQSQGPVWNEFLKFECQVGDLQTIKKVEDRRATLASHFNEFDGRQALLLVDRYKFLNLLPCSVDELKQLGYREVTSTHEHVSSMNKPASIISANPSETIARDRRIRLPRPDIKHLMPYEPTRNPLPGSHPTPGGVFPLPDTALYLVKVLPPARNFEVNNVKQSLT
jgi:cleavage stimulation factor subunit 3